VVIHTSYASWSTAVGGGDAKIDFNLGSAQELFDQYAGLGLHFSGTAQVGSGGAAMDGWSAATLFPNFATTIDFDADQVGIAFDLMTLFKVSLFKNGTLVGEVPQLNTFGPVFRGVTSDQAFDRVILQALPGTAPGHFDNMYVANPVPGPGGAAIAMLAFARMRRRRG
jgi:hypothetical protein